jgi:hypothetical protein
VDGTLRGSVLKSNSINASLASETMWSSFKMDLICWTLNKSNAPRKVTSSQHVVSVQRGGGGCEAGKNIAWY